MTTSDWAASLPGAVTVCDAEGIVTYLNDRSAEEYAKDGGRDLIGKNLLDCHPEPARTKMEALLTSPHVNAYTIEKKGVHKLIYHAPLYSHGVFAGVVEMALEIPADLPHFVRKG
jgi:transcriptional regulator with PAS, ATPase and Fis domain